MNEYKKVLQLYQKSINSYIYILHNNICNIKHFDGYKRICGIHVERYHPKQTQAMIAFLTDSVCCHKNGIYIEYLSYD